MDHHMNVMARGLAADPSAMSAYAGRYDKTEGAMLTLFLSILIGPLAGFSIVAYELYAGYNQKAKKKEFIDVLPTLLKELHSLSETPDGSNKVVRVQFKKGDQVETITITEKEDGCEISSDWLDGESRMLHGVTLETLRYKIAKEISMRPDVYGMGNANMPEVRATLLEHDLKIAVRKRQYYKAASVAERLAKTWEAVDNMIRANRWLKKATAYDKAATKVELEPRVNGERPKRPFDPYPVIVLPRSAVRV